MTSFTSESPMSINSSHNISATTPENFSEGSMISDSVDNGIVSPFNNSPNEKSYIKSEESMSEKSSDVAQSAMCPTIDCKERRLTLKYTVINQNSADEDYISDRICNDCRIKEEDEVEKKCVGDNGSEQNNINIKSSIPKGPSTIDESNINKESDDSKTNEKTNGIIIGSSTNNSVSNLVLNDPQVKPSDHKIFAPTNSGVGKKYELYMTLVYGSVITKNDYESLGKDKITDLHNTKLTRWLSICINICYPRN